MGISRQQRRALERQIAKQAPGAGEELTLLERLEMGATELEEMYTLERVVVEHTADPFPSWLTDALHRARAAAKPGRPPAVFAVIGNTETGELESFALLDARAIALDPVLGS
jgi:hypothetical protein